MKKREHISWKEALERCQASRGDIEVQVFDVIHRGPIKDVAEDDDKVIFGLVWCASYDLATDRWTAVKEPQVLVLKKTTEVALATDGRLIVTGPGITVAKIFPAGGDRLYPSEVDDFDLVYPSRAQAAG